MKLSMAQFHGDRVLARAEEVRGSPTLMGISRATLYAYVEEFSKPP